MRCSVSSLVTLVLQRFCKNLSVEPPTMDSVEPLTMDFVKPAYNGIHRVRTATEVP